MDSIEKLLEEGFKTVELEERLEIVHMTALTEEANASVMTDYKTDQFNILNFSDPDKT